MKKKLLGLAGTWLSGVTLAVLLAAGKEKKISRKKLFGVVLGLCFLMLLSGCVSTGIGEASVDKFSGITKQVATLAVFDIGSQYFKIQKASKAGEPDVYMMFARNHDAGKRYLGLNIDGEYIEVSEDDADFDVSSSQYGVTTYRSGAFVLTKQLRQKLLSATTISARYQQESPIFENKIPVEQLREFLK